MERYFTFFLYGKKPSESQAILEFVDWLVQSTTRDGSLHVIARAKGEDLKTSIQGGFAECRNKLNSLSLAALNVTSLKRTNAGSEIFFRYESGPEGPKTITYSLRSDLWEAYEQIGFSAQLLTVTEHLFVSHGCLYGCGHSTHYVIPGRFSLIRGNSQSGVPRIVDFDYTRYIEDIYRYNYVSGPLLAAIDEARLRKHEGIDVRDIFNDAGLRAGLAIYLADESSMNVAWARDCLQSVLWTAPVPNIHPLAMPGENR
jgi:hypothetical protein